MVSSLFLSQKTRFSVSRLLWSLVQSLVVSPECMLCASRPPLVRDLVYVASNAFTKSDLKKMERTICNAIRFEVSPSPSRPPRPLRLE